ncbi:hypothetical protein NHX12_012900, partial [Muraenolepis orangiensis]
MPVLGRLYEMVFLALDPIVRKTDGTFGTGSTSSVMVASRFQLSVLLREEVAQLQEEVHLLRQMKDMLSRDLEESQGGRSADLLSATELRVQLADKEEELDRAKEALQGGRMTGMAEGKVGPSFTGVTELCGEVFDGQTEVQTEKADRKRLKAEKADVVNQMQQLYATLESREEQLRDFIRNYDQHRKVPEVRGQRQLRPAQEGTRVQRSKATTTSTERYHSSEVKGNYDQHRKVPQFRGQRQLRPAQKGTRVQRSKATTTSTERYQSSEVKGNYDQHRKVPEFRGQRQLRPAQKGTRVQRSKATTTSTERYQSSEVKGNYDQHRKVPEFRGQRQLRPAQKGTRVQRSKATTTSTERYQSSEVKGNYDQHRKVPEFRGQRQLRPAQKGTRVQRSKATTTSTERYQSSEVKGNYDQHRKVPQFRGQRQLRPAQKGTTVQRSKATTTSTERYQSSEVKGNYDQHRKLLAKEKDLLEREKWDLRRQNKESSEHTGALRSQLDLKENRIKELEAELAMISNCVNQRMDFRVFERLADRESPRRFTAAKQSLATLTKDVPKRHSLAMPAEMVVNGNNQEWVMHADLPLTAAIRQMAAVRLSPCHSRQPSAFSDASAMEGDRSSTPSDINSPRHRTHSLCN